MLRRLFFLFSALLLPLSLSSCALFEVWDQPQEVLPYDYRLENYLTLGAYKGLSVTQSEIAPTQAEMTAQMESDFAVLLQLTDRPAALGDTVHLNYTAVFEGEEYDDDTEDGFRITLGENALGIPGFDEGLVGATPGDTVSLDLTFPADYAQTPEYAGKDVSFLVTVNYICLDLPELTDEIVSANTSYETVDTYLAGLEEMLCDIKKVELLWQQVLDSSRVLEYPEKEYENYYTEYLDAYTELAATYNMTLAELVEESGGTMTEFYEEADRVTQSYIKEDLIVYSIARAEGITVSAEEYEAGVIDYYQSSASDYYLSAELMEETLGEEILTQQFLSNKVLDFIVEHSIVTEE